MKAGGAALPRVALALCVAEPCDPFGGGRERDALAGQAGPDAERDRQVGLAGAGRAEQDDVLPAVQEVELAEVLDHLLLDRALEGEVELLERLSGREAGGLDACSRRRGCRARRPRRRARLEEALIAPGLLAGALGELGSARAAAGAFSARNRCASSEVGLMRDQRVIGDRELLDIDLCVGAGGRAGSGARSGGRDR